MVVCVITSSSLLEANQHGTLACSPPTLPSHFIPSPSTVKPAVYSKPHMTFDDYPGLARISSELGTSMGLLLAVLHVGLSLVQLHQNVAEHICTKLDLGHLVGLHHSVSQMQVSVCMTMLSDKPVQTLSPHEGSV